MENASGRSHMRVCECKRKPETHTVMTVCPKKKKIWPRRASSPPRGVSHDDDASLCTARAMMRLAFARAARARDAPSLAAAMSCRLIASTSASEASGGTKSDPSALCAEMVSYARQAWRSGDRVTATGVLEHGADLIARATEGQPEVAAAAHAAKSRTHLAWAAMQSVRHRVPETEKKRKSEAAYLATPCRFSFPHAEAR